MCRRRSLISENCRRLQVKHLYASHRSVSLHRGSGKKMDSNLQLEKLFRACDKQGTGHIGPQEFRELCAGFDIDAVDSDAIFTDLDHDGDGQVSLEDFAWGFRDFLSPGSRRASMQIMQDKDLERLEELERRHSQARQAWSHLVAGVGMDSVHKFLNNSGKKLAELYEELQATETASHLVIHFEGALSSLLQDVKKLHEDNKKMEDMFTREKETHLAHLRDLEEELDAQVARVEAQARQEAQAKFEAEKRRLEERMETEIAELQAHLRMFQKLNTMLSRNQSEKQSVVANTSQETTFENRELRTTLADTQTNLALLRSEMAQLRANYEAKCQELNCQQETMLTYLHQNDHMYQQLELLHEANTKLQDTNDSLLTVMDVSGLRSPRPSSPCCCSHASSTGSGVGHSEAPKHIRNSHPPSRSPSDAESLVDSAPVCLGSGRLDIHFGIQRLMEDLDSGRSTMRDVTDVDSDRSLQEELQRTISGLSAGSDSEGDIKHQQLDELSNGLADFPSTKNPCLGRRLIPVGNSIQVPSDTITTELEPIGAPDRTFKIVFAGDAAVGKSCFIVRFCKGVFISNLGSTLGVDFQVKTIRVDERNVTLQLWDTAGQERFRSMTRTYFRRADGVMLLYDVTSERSFLNVRQWVQSIDEVSEHRMPIVLCGNKVDLRPEAQKKGITCVTMMDGELLARDYGAIFLETSSKTGTNILDAVLALSRDMLTREDVEVQTSSLCTLHEHHKEGSSCCVKKN